MPGEYLKRRVRFGVLSLAATLCVLPVLAHAASLVDSLAMAGAKRQLGSSAVNARTAMEEALLISGIEALEQNRMDDAVSYLEELVERRPDFQLAQLVYADLLSARTRPLGRFGGLNADEGERLEALRDEARRRLAHFRSSPSEDRLPENLVMPGRNQQHLIVVDVSASRLYLFENDEGRLRRVADQYVSSGKKGAVKLREGDQKTPLGVYFVTGRISSAKLPDFYGAGAIPINYPNEWDMRLGRTGYGIWIHGVPSNTYSRAPRASDGCIAVANGDLKTLWSRIPGTNVPVIIGDSLRWEDRDSLESRRRQVESMLKAWRRDWESLDFDRYARHYSRDFVGEGLDRPAWMAKKRRINAAKTFIDVDLANLSAFAYPGEEDMLVVTFDQDYKSSNYADRTTKRQYWRREADGHWRIVVEEEARFLEVHYRGLPYSARASLTRLND